VRETEEQHVAGLELAEGEELERALLPQVRVNRDVAWTTSISGWRRRMRSVSPPV
jgi:hypothetical protein